MNPYLISNITWEEYHAKTTDGMIIVPVGATEQHSRHLPLGVDTIITEGMALALAKETDALVAPTICYGYKSQPSSGGGPLFPGTIDLNGQTLTLMVRDILKELLDDGWQKILILNGHYENHAFLIEAADLLLRDQKTRFPKVILTSWWDCISDEVMPKVFDEVPFAGWELEHAAIVETSAMMHFAPDLVHEEQFLEEGLEKVPNYHCFPPDPDLLPASGNLHTPCSSSAEKGRLIAENVIANLQELVKKEL